MTKCYACDIAYLACELIQDEEKKELCKQIVDRVIAGSLSAVDAKKEIDKVIGIESWKELLKRALEIAREAQA